jgi:hypothetical protein
LAAGEALGPGLLKGLPEVDVANDTLVMFVRSGDIFTGHPDGSKHYWQPPIRFYLDVMKQRKWARVEIVSEDEENPVIPILKSEGAIWQKRSFAEDVALLTRAKNLIIGRSTFGYFASVVSRDLTELWTAGQPSTRLPPHWDCSLPAGFMKIVTEDQWAATAEQRRALVDRNFACVWKRWENHTADDVRLAGGFG